MKNDKLMMLFLGISIGICAWVLLSAVNKIEVHPA